MAVKHTFTSTIEDGADNTLVQPSDWNAEHVLSNALGAIDALTPAASKIPYFTGAAAATLADITATGVSLLGVADAAAGRTALGLGTIATQAASNVSLTGGSISGMTSIGGVLLSLASDSGAEHVFCKTNDTSNSNQSCVFALRHYSSAAEEAATAFRLVSESGVNQLYLGGGALNHNACTMIKFYTARNNTTLGGTERARLINAGRWLFGTTTDDGASLMQVAGDIKTTSGSFILGTTASISTSQIGPVTTDGSDTASFSIRGGGSAAATRGSFIACYGNEHATNPGMMKLNVGSTGSMEIYTSTGYKRFEILAAGRILAGPTPPTDDETNALQLGGDMTVSGVYKVDGVQVVSNRVVDARIDDTINESTWDSTTAGVLDAIRDAMIAHGLMAAA